MRARSKTKPADFWALTKPEINFLIAIATFAGFYMGLPTEVMACPCVLLIHTLVGTLLVSSGAGVLNQYVERHFDAQMQRTQGGRSWTAGSILLRLFGSGFCCLSVAASIWRRQLTTSEFARAVHAGELSGRVHTAQTKNASVHIGWCFPGAMPPLDRMGCRIGDA